MNHELCGLTLPGGFLGGLLRCARTGKDAQHPFSVPLVTRILVDLGLNLLEINGDGPGPGPRSRVGEGDFVVDRIRRDTGEAFDDMQVFRRSQKVVLEGEVRGVDDQRCAVPSAPRVSAQPGDTPGKMRAPVQGNDARVVERLHQEHDVSGRLQDLKVTVEGIAARAGTDSRYPRSDATDVVVEILRTRCSDVPCRRGGPSLPRLG